jgi:hypothetical protein
VSAASRRRPLLGGSPIGAPRVPPSVARAGLSLTAVQLCPGRRAQFTAELHERRQLPVLRELEAEPARDLPHRGYLGRASDARHGMADVDGRANTLMKQARLEEDLPVGDRDASDRSPSKRAEARNFGEDAPTLCSAAGRGSLLPTASQRGFGRATGCRHSTASVAHARRPPVSDSFLRPARACY